MNVKTGRDPALGTAPVGKLFWKLALPAIAAQLVNVLYNIVDRIYIGHIPVYGAAALTGVGVTMPAIMIISAFAALVSAGGAPRVSMLMGKGAPDSAERIIGTCTFTLCAISLALTLIMQLFAVPILRLFGASDATLPYALEYISIYSLGTIFVQLSLGLNAFITAQGFSTTSMLTVTIGAALNIVLDPLFIFVIGWGTDGAAIATALSQLSVFLLFIYRLKVKQTLFPHLSLFTRLKRRYTSRILHLGTPAALLNLAFAFINMYMCKIAASTGGHIGLMTLTAGGQIEAITWNTAQGFSTALSSFVAQNYAAGKVYRVLKAYRTTLWLTGCIGFVCTFLFVFLGKEIFAVFVPEEAAYMAGSVFMRIDGYSQVFMMLEITMEGMFYGTGRSVQPAVISIGGNVLRIPLSVYLVSIGLGVSGIWWAISLSSILKGACALLWFHHMKNRIFSVNTL